jgi:hypothetical protein
MLSVQVFGLGGHDRNTAPEYVGLMGARRKHFAMRSPPFAGIAQRHEPTPR